MFLIKLRILAPLASFNDMRRSGERGAFEFRKVLWPMF